MLKEKSLAFLIFLLSNPSYFQSFYVDFIFDVDLELDLEISRWMVVSRGHARFLQHFTTMIRAGMSTILAVTITAVLMLPFF